MLFSPRGGAKGAGWMITLADLLSLLVSFFALLYATTATDPTKWNHVVKPISAYLTGAALPSEETPKSVPAKPNLDGDYGLALLRSLTETDPALAGARVSGDEATLRLGLPARQGYADWVSGTPSPLAGLGHFIRGLHGRAEASVYRQGRLEGASIATLWQDALDEAAMTAVALRDAGVEDKVTVTGMAEPGGAGASRAEIVIHLPSDPEASHAR